MGRIRCSGQRLVLGSERTVDRSQCRVGGNSDTQCLWQERLWFTHRYVFRSHHVVRTLGGRDVEDQSVMVIPVRRS